MRILVVQESDWLRRNPVQHHHMLERLSAEGHDVLVLDYPIRWRDEGAGLVAPRRVHRHVARVVEGADVTVVRTAKLRVPALGKLSWLATSALEMERAFRAYRPDVVVVLGLSNGLPALRMAKARGIPVVVHLIDALHTLAEPAALRPVARAFERALLRGAESVVAINHALAAYAVRMGARPERVLRIPTGVDTRAFGSHVDGAKVRAEHGIALHEHVLLFVGWLYPFSGLRELAQQMAADPRAAAGMRLLVVGDGDLMPELERVRDEGLGHRLVLAGRQPLARMPEFVAAADTCLLPAQLNETMAHIVPAKVYEYLAGGKPVLASPLPGLRAEFGEGGGIRYVGGARALLQAAGELAADPAGRSRLGAAARETAERNGDWETVTARFAAVLGLAEPASATAGLGVQAQRS